MGMNTAHQTLGTFVGWSAGFEDHIQGVAWSRMEFRYLREEGDTVPFLNFGLYGSCLRFDAVMVDSLLPSISRTALQRGDWLIVSPHLWTSVAKYLYRS